MQKFKTIFYYWLAAVVTAVAVFGSVYTNVRAGEMAGSEAYFTHHHVADCYETKNISCNGQHEETRDERTIKGVCDNCRGETSQHYVEITYTCPVAGGLVGEYFCLTCNRCKTVLEEYGSVAQHKHEYSETKIICGLSEGEKTAVLRITADNTWTGNGVNLSAGVDILKQDKANKSFTYSWNGGFLYVTDNGTYSVTVTNAAGQVVSSDIQISCIDKTAPVIGAVMGNTDTMTKNSITVSVAAGDSGSGLPDAAYSIDGGSTWSNSSTFTVTEGTAVSFVVRDRVGNVSRMTIKRSDFAYPPEPTAAPTATPKATAQPTIAPTATPKATAQPPIAPTATPKATAQPTVAPTATPKATEQPTAAPTATPKATAQPTAAPTATSKVTAQPTAAPTATPKATEQPTAAPTATPKATAQPTAAPTATPKATAQPTTAPTAEPTVTPKVTAAPTAAPTVAPKATAQPTAAPTATPKVTEQPTVTPAVTMKPTTIPGIIEPSAMPASTEKPTVTPAPYSPTAGTPGVTVNPMVTPTATPTAMPTAAPAVTETKKPASPTTSHKQVTGSTSNTVGKTESSLSKTEKDKFAAAALGAAGHVSEKADLSAEENLFDEEKPLQETDTSEEEKQDRLTFPTAGDGNGGNRLLPSGDARQSEGTGEKLSLNMGLIVGVLLVFCAIFCVLRMLWLYSVQLYCYDGGDEYRRLGMLHLKRGKNEFVLFLPEYMTENVKTPRYRLLMKSSLVKKCRKMELVVQNEEHKLRQPLEECIDFML